MTLWNYGEDHWSAFFVCPACTNVAREPAHVRNSYCPTCHDFTGEPREFILHGSEPPGWAECMEHMLRWRFTSGFYDNQPIRVLTDEEREEMLAHNLAALRFEERMAVTLIRPRTVTRRPWWRRLREYLQGGGISC